MKASHYFVMLLVCLLFSNKALAWTLVSSPLPPYTIRNPETPGIAIEIFSLLANELDQKVNVKILPWARAQRLVTQGQSFFIAPLTRTPNREKLYDWLIPFKKYQLKLVTNKPTLDINNEEVLKKVRICALRSSPAHWEAIKQDVTSITLFNDETKCMHMLGLKRVDAVLVHGVDSARWGYHFYGFDPSELIYSSSYSDGTLYLASTIGLLSKTEIHQLRKKYQTLQAAGKINEIYKKYRLFTKKTYTNYKNVMRSYHVKPITISHPTSSLLSGDSSKIN